MSTVDTRYSQTAPHMGENTAADIDFLMQPGKFIGSNLFRGGTLSPGDIIRITAWGTFTTSGGPPSFSIELIQAANLLGLAMTGLPASQALLKWGLLAMITIRPANKLVCEGVWTVDRPTPTPPLQIGRPDPGNANRLREFAFNPANDASFQVSGVMGAAVVGNSMTLEQCSIEYLQKWVMPMRPAPGSINFYASPVMFTPTNNNKGTLSSTAVYSSGTFYGATAFADLGTTGNTSSVAFTYQGSEVAGGAAVGLRWSDSAQQGIFAYIDSSGPTLKIYEMSSGWVYGQTASISLTLTTGNSYTLTLSDSGSVVTATLIDDVGVRTCNINTTLNTSNTQFTFGWIGTTASHAFSAAITDIEATQSSTVATPIFSPDFGNYNSTQSVTIRTYPPGAAIHYTTDGSTPTGSSTLYTGPISVSASETVKAFAILAAWTNSAVGSAAYTITPVLTVGYASTSGTPATTLSTTVDVVAGLVVVKVWSDAPISSVKFGGATMNMGNIQGVGSPSTGATVGQFYYACSAGTAVTVLATVGASANIQMEIVNVTGLTNNAPDNSGATVAHNGGNSSTPDTGATPTSASANAVAIAVFAVVNPGGSITWGGTPTLITDAQDVTDVIGGSTYTLTGAYYVASATRTFDAALSGITPAYWGGTVAVYS